MTDKTLDPCGSVSSTELGAVAPSRAFRLTLKLESDNRTELAWALRNMADQVDREQLTIGVSGGAYSGAIYELLEDPKQTHQNYFRQVQEYLRDKTPNTEGQRP